MSWSLRNGSLDIATLQKLYHAGTLRPTELVEAVYERVAQLFRAAYLDLSPAP